jgi:hypothetical protein
LHEPVFGGFRLLLDLVGNLKLERHGKYVVVYEENVEFWECISQNWIETLSFVFAATMNLVCRKSYQILLSYTGGEIKLKLSLSPMAMKTTLVLSLG